MRILQWSASGGPGRLAELVAEAAGPGVVCVAFDGSGDGGPVPWAVLEPWTACRAVTVADVRSPLGSPGLEVALTCDLVIAREGVRLELPAGERAVPSGVVWAAGRAGRAALARVLLTDAPVEAPEALALGLVHRVVPPGADLPVDDGLSSAAATAARDLMRAHRRGAPGALELATFRLLFAIGDPAEGARAFLERRAPEFGGRRTRPGR